MTKRVEQATAIRDHVLALMRDQSTCEIVDGIRVQVWKRDGFTVLLNTPFTPLPHGLPPTPTYRDALALSRAKKPLPYELSLWAGLKVLAVEWNDHELRIITFKRGDWEQRILALA